MLAPNISYRESEGHRSAVSDYLFQTLMNYPEQL